MDENSTPPLRPHVDNTSVEFELLALIVSLQLQAIHLSQLGRLTSENAHEGIYNL